MKPEHKRYILENVDKKPLERIALELNMKERKLKKFLARHKADKSYRAAAYSRNNIMVTAACLVLIFILGLAAYINSISGKFVWDDGSLIVSNTYIRDFSRLGDIFKENIRGGAAKAGSFYRPLQIVTYAIDYAVWGFDVRGYHITNIILHILVAFLVFWLTYILFNQRPLSLFTSILYVLHPVHAEAVAYISGRADPLAALFIVTGLCLYIRYQQGAKRSFVILSAACYILALLARESAIIFPAAVLLYHYIFKKRLRLRAFLPVLGVAIAYILIRSTLLKHTLPPLAKCPTTLLQRLPGFFIAIAGYMRIIFLPFHLHMEYSDKTFPVTDPRVFIGVIIFLALLICAFRQREKRPLLSFSICWFFIFLIPHSNIYPINAYMAEHWLYLPSVGFFLIIGEGLIYLYRQDRYRMLSVIILTGLAGFYLVRTIQQNIYWREPTAFYERTLKYAPDSAVVNNNLGELYHHAGRQKEARVLLEHAIKSDPEYAGAYSNLASSYKSTGEMDKAVEFYKKALKIRPDAEYIYYNLGLIYKDMGMLDESIAHFKKTIALNPVYAYGYNGLGVAYFAAGRRQESISMFAKAIELDSMYGEAYRNLGVSYYYTGKKDKAKEALKKGIEAAPDYLTSYKDLAVLYIEEGNYELALRYYNMGTARGLKDHAVETALNALAESEEGMSSR